MKREISYEFSLDLKSGVLKPLLDYVKANNDLLFEIRDEYINIYYRGGMLLRVKPNGISPNYLFEWDINYLENKSNTNSKKISKTSKLKIEYELSKIQNICTINGCRKWIAFLPRLTRHMDDWFKVHPKKEKFIQQEILKAGVLPDYIISDFEYQKGQKARFDLMGLKPVDQHHILSFIELKQGYSSLRTKKQSNGKFTSGLKKHLIDILDEIIIKQDILKEKKQAIVLLNKKNDLGLITSGVTLPKNIKDDEIEVLFVIADYQTVNSSNFSIQLKREIADINKFLKGYSKKFELHLKIMFLKTEQKGKITTITDVSDIVDYMDYDALMRRFY